MSPSKLELLTAWLPTRPWFRDSGRAPQLSKAGGFRLDDPAGAVGIEFVLVTDSAGPEPITYHVPLTYRGTPLDGAEDALVGTSIHGVLGQRWIYDATRDPVAVAQIVALLAGQAQPQAQSASDTPDPSVVVSTGEVTSAATGFGSALEAPTHTDIAVGSGRNIRVERILRAAAPNSTVASDESATDGPHPDTPAEIPSSGVTLANSESGDSRRSDEPIPVQPDSARVTMPWQDVTGSTVRSAVLAINA
ncbi:maltokinase N-terminal cap-like domain-containing protein [Nocardia anaemiae]|uniref:maltokinase N-terminal cap-like domain-containing protein n=1 Tax=Nocardia anaemiae TaxID=263910 RepID=UPI001FDF915F|nr:1,4-alpha-glucan branching protein [Nocardia anaemiae]